MYVHYKFYTHTQRESEKKREVGGRATVMIQISPSFCVQSADFRICGDLLKRIARRSSLLLSPSPFPSLHRGHFDSFCSSISGQLSRLSGMGRHADRSRGTNWIFKAVGVYYRLCPLSPLGPGGYSRTAGWGRGEHWVRAAIVPICYSRI